MGAELSIEVIFRVALSIGMLSYASYKDIKTREISDLVWIIFGVAGLILNIYEFYNGTLGLLPLLVAVGFSIGFSILTGYLGLFGGADLLAIIVIGLLNPVAPVLGFKSPLISSVIFPLTVISNSVLIAASGMVVVFFYNLMNIRDMKIFQGYIPISPWRRIMLFLTGLNKDINTIRGPPFEYPLEKIGEYDTVTLLLMPNFFDDAGAVETIKKLRLMERKRVWVSYSLPFLFVLEMGYLSSILFGDFTLWLVGWFMH
ncbi:MAG: prepilin peptidase [Candidatus Bathyarchaeota archaeon]|nr:prepilin peptidase [Candidatus Bathyarchaeota archaeon]